MRGWSLLVITGAFAAAAAWQAPAAAQQTAATHRPAAGDAPITFAAYRDFRLDDLARREARLAERLEEPGLAAAERLSLERQKNRCDRLAAMPAAVRDRLFRSRFDRIDANHDGKLDAAERAAWRLRQREYYRQLALARARENAAPPR
jgi:hypothetical protein